MARRRGKGKRSTGGNLLGLVALAGAAVVVLVGYGTGAIGGNRSNTRTPVQDARPTRTATPRPATRVLNPTAFSTATPYPRTYSVISGVNARSCPETTCEVVANFAVGDQVLVVGYERGEAIGRDDVWRIVEVNGERMFVHNSLISVNSNVIATSRPAATRDTGNTVIPISTAAATQSWQCAGDVYNCGDFANRSELLSYFNACPGDPSRMDQDGDGVPCE